MPSFSEENKKKLATCHPDIVKVMNEAIKHYDFTVLYGHRTAAEQLALYAQGRTKPGKIVTQLDGVNKKSKHNHSPSLAVDIAPYPIDWDDLGRFKALAKVIKEAAAKVGVKIVWGGNWAHFKDWPHYEIG